MITKINLINIDWKKYAGYIIAIIFILLYTFSCNDNTPNDKVIQKVITIHKTAIKTLHDTIIIKEKEIIKVRIEVEKKVDAVANFTNDSITNYYRKRYNTVNEIKPVSGGIVFTDSIAKVNITELIKYDGVVQELKLTNDILDNTKSIVDQQNEIIDIVELQNKELTKSVKKQKQQKTIVTIIAVGAFIGGVLIGGLVK